MRKSRLKLIALVGLAVVTVGVVIFRDNFMMWTCKTSGGYWVTADNTFDKKPMCDKRTIDAEKLCTDSKQCESYCRAPDGVQPGTNKEGKCFEWRHANCITEVKDGVVQEMDCVDSRIF